MFSVSPEMSWCQLPASGKRRTEDAGTSRVSQMSSWLQTGLRVSLNSRATSLYFCSFPTSAIILRGDIYHIYIYICIIIYICMYMYIAYIYIYVYVRMYVHTYIRTHVGRQGGREGGRQRGRQGGRWVGKQVSWMHVCVCVCCQILFSSFLNCNLWTQPHVHAIPCMVFVMNVSINTM